MKLLIGAFLGAAGVLLAIAWFFKDDGPYADIDDPDSTEIPDLPEPGSNGS